MAKPGAVGSADAAAKNGGRGGSAPSGARERRLAWRSCFLGVAPLATALLGFARPQVSFCVFVTAVGFLMEASIVYKVKLAECCRKVPFILRLLAVYCFQLQACWLLAPAVFWSGDGAARTGSAPSPEPSPPEPPPVADMAEPSAQEISTLSVVLPCANETDFVMKTVRSIFDATPEGELHEIIIVDDQSAPRISDFLNATELESHRARIIRHDSPQGLIRSKKHGADNAEGDIIVFLDCHVKPMEGWTQDLFSNIRQNPKRIIVPTITSLDPETWEEVSAGGGKKMCLTWNADFYWCNGYPGPYVPIMSGGLLALSRFWWNTTGGYDSEMHAWGGENLDQSLRTWLCGGEIMVAETSRVAHMWRDPSKPKTQLHYSIPTEHVRRNRLRAAKAWMGEWAEKVASFPEFEDFKEGGPLHIGSLEDIDMYRRKLNCQGFKSYLQRFKDLYESTGQFPARVFNLRHRKSKLCLHHELAYHSNRGGAINLRPCSRGSEAQRWHSANAKNGGGIEKGQCCSGIKLWDLDICASSNGHGNALAAQACLIFGESSSQHLQLSDKGLLEWSNAQACVSLNGAGDGGLSYKAAMFRGNSCVSKVESLKDGFRVARHEKHGPSLCLSVYGAAENGQALRFTPCADDNQHQIFKSNHRFEDGHQQIRSLRNFCIDAANGHGPIEYVCHDAKEYKPGGSVEQHFHADENKSFVWEARKEHGSLEFCVDTAPEYAQLAPCAGSHDTPKAGQGFRKQDVRTSDGSFQLWEPESGFCLGPAETTPDHQQSFLVSLPCAEGDVHRWQFVEGQLRSLHLKNHCIDANDQTTPILYPCYPPHQNPKQTFKFHENGWIEIPRSWADNGRVRFLAKCLDSRPAPPSTVILNDCKSADEWEELWPEVPLETQLWKDATKTDSFLRRS